MKKYQVGAVSPSIFAIIALALLVVVFGGFSVWAYLNYVDQKTDVDARVAEASAKAVLEKSEELEAKFAEEEKKPMRQFAGPADYGRLTFDYPKTWSAYQATDISRGGGITYDAYLNPILVPPVSEKQKFAIRIKIEQKNYEQIVASYDAKIKRGDLKSSVYSDENRTGTRIEGKINDDIIGTMVILKVPNTTMTLTIRTDGDVFKDDFEALLKTVQFNE